ncbi:MAG TPA: hypothetical protein PKW15_06685, partial [Alphaproteobacteria bacterium]|nr:hypothetical protein [Alphaproteobacteria bacterium]
MTERKILIASLMVVTALAVSACGNTRGERGLSGAGIGAAAGGIGAAALGGNPWTGAAVGGVIGGATGALTD